MAQLCFGMIQGDPSRLDASVFVRAVAVLGFITFSVKLLEESLQKPLWLWSWMTAAEAILLFLQPVQPSFILSLCICLAIMEFVLLAFASELTGSLYALRSESILSIPWTIRLTVLLVSFVTSGLLLSFFAHGFAHSHLVEGRQANLGQGDQTAFDTLNVSHLGGPFLGTSRVLLRVFAKRPTYYLGEIYSDYTGQEWKANTPQMMHWYPVGAPIQMNLLSGGVSLRAPYERELRQTVEVVSGSYPVLFGADQIVAVETAKRSQQYQFNPQTDAFSLGEVGPGTTYTVVSEVPRISARALLQVRNGSLAYAFPTDLELPADFPARDVALARAITQGARGTYEKVEALIAYLRTHEHYATKDIPFLKPGQDAVDQFLFVTHRGYCDQYASALATLARAVGIPARYAIGFVAVPPDKRDSGRMQEYELRGTDAHAWTQIWFAGYGWVSFDATPPASWPQSQRVQQLALTKRVLRQIDPSSMDKRSTLKQRSLTSISAVFAHSTWSMLVFVAGSVVVFGLIPFFLLRRISSRRNCSHLISSNVTMTDSAQGVKDLLDPIYRKYGPRASSQTLREYVQNIGAPDDRGKLMQFVQWYEKICYGQGELTDSAGFYKDANDT
ncbi:transglutaminase TgpA family protein [Sulfoacidibacillus thermotolerans]|nr:transglutaminase domain-containing protein [Sulfoacidibacillus thermotolerans]